MEQNPLLLTVLRQLAELGYASARALGADHDEALRRADVALGVLIGGQEDAVPLQREILFALRSRHGSRPDHGQS